MVVFPQNAGTPDWVRNIEKNSAVKVYGGGAVVSGTARKREVRDLKDPLLAIFVRKYGETEVRKRYWGQHTYIEIEILSRIESTDYADLFYSDLEAAFDGVAEHYDQHILGNPMNMWLRNRSVEILAGAFLPGDLVLEIGCGTGTETLQLAERGVKVIASDLSSKMLAVLESKAEKMGLTGMVTPLHARPYMLKQKLRELGYGQLDGAYSTYGAINTDPNLPLLFSDLHSILRPGGTLVLGVWNKFCLYEMVGYSMRMRPGMAVARLKNPVPVGKSRFCVPSTAYSVGSLNRLIRGSFELKKVTGVEIVLPPSNLTRYLPREPLRSLIRRIDVSLGVHYPWNRLGDHFLGVYSRRA